MIKTTQNGAPAPAPGQDDTTRPPQDLVTISGTAIVLNVPSAAPVHVDAWIRNCYVQYTSDPRVDAGTPGLWRTGWDGVPERLSSFAVRRVVVGCHGMEVSLILPRTGESRLYAGTLDEISSAVHRAGVRLGVRGDRQGIFWALREFVGLAQRQAAARGGC